MSNSVVLISHLLEAHNFGFTGIDYSLDFSRTVLQTLAH
jgi:hypothetical protein